MKKFLLILAAAAVVWLLFFRRAASPLTLARRSIGTDSRIQGQGIPQQDKLGWLLGAVPLVRGIFSQPTKPANGGVAPTWEGDDQDAQDDFEYAMDNPQDNYPTEDYSWDDSGD